MRNHPYKAPRNEAWVSRCAYHDEASGEYCRKAEEDSIHRGHFLPSGTAGVVTCPFRLCGKTVTVRDSTPFLVEQHKIAWLADPVIAGMPCPGSLMPHPITSEARTLLDHQEQDMQAHIWRSNQKENTLPGSSTGKMAGPSQNLHQPGRIGREPGPKAPEWHLGGRVDEDVIPHNETVRGKVPPGVLGAPVGRGLEMSISQGAGLARRSVVSADKAWQELADARALINESISGVVELLGDGEGQTLKDWLATLNGIVQAIEETKEKIAVANEYGNNFIAKLMS